ncbi:MAG: POTRA domain-containing protein, partial [Planctomycetota bacterium]
MIVSLLMAFFMAGAIQDPAPAEGVILDIQFTGREHISERTLLRVAAIELDVFRFGDQRRSALDDAAFFMEEAYRHEGFPDAQVHWELETLSDRYRAHFSILEGQALLLGTLQFPGAEELHPEQLAGLLGLRPDGKSKQPFRRSELEGLASTIREAYWQLGFLETEVTAPEFYSEDDGARCGARFYIVEGTGYTLNKILFLEPGPLGQTEMAEVVESFLGLPYFPRRQTEITQLIRRR